MTDMIRQSGFTNQTHLFWNLILWPSSQCNVNLILVIIVLTCWNLNPLIIHLGSRIIYTISITLRVRPLHTQFCLTLLFFYIYTVLSVFNVYFINQYTATGDYKCINVHFVTCMVSHRYILYQIIIIIMYIYHSLINALSAHMIHINLNAIFYTDSADLRCKLSDQWEEIPTRANE